jgi:hypothetical protein
LAAPAGLLADGFVEGHAAVGEGYCADDEGEGIKSAIISECSYADCSRAYFGII